jgi:hypothetical protein
LKKNKINAIVVELVDTADLKSAGEGRAGSNPASRTKYLTVAQGIEQQPSKLWAAGSIPAGQAISGNVSKH